eukprot:CAMPEP_0197874534 /NCGR_PEP_ID=MMETSP1439-20131203/4023_1 /TAXON_ID=66791 /ORGANISM="Gonyaulax spinifera, Strain CCMP409" /LENGTH=774 /DNA_ID=CAMNT_0043493665 /DNA_START=37 /DNA_END=2361 /DNA_ORIENTATION=-
MSSKAKRETSSHAQVLWGHYRRAFAATRYVLLPIIVLYSFLLYSNRFPTVACFLKYAIAHCIGLLSLDAWCSRAVSIDGLLKRLRRRDDFNLFMCHVGYVVCTAVGELESFVLSKFAASILIPFTSVYISTNDGHAITGLSSHFLATIFSVWERLWGDGWQTLVGLLIFDTLLMEMKSASRQALKSQAEMVASNTTIASVLSIVCDGFFVVDNTNHIIGFSKEASRFCKHPHDDPGSGRGRAFTDVITPCGNTSSMSATNSPEDHFPLGLSTGTVQMQDSESFNVDVYSVPCLASLENVGILLGYGPASKFVADLKKAKEIRQPHRIHAIRISDIDLTHKESKRVVAPGAKDEADEQASSTLDEWSSEDHLFLKAGFHRTKSGPGCDSEVSLCTKKSITSATAGLPTQLSKTWHILRDCGPGGLIKQYADSEVQARGGHGLVYKVKDEVGTQFAVKEIRLKGVLWSKDWPRIVRRVDREARLLQWLAYAASVIVTMHQCWMQPNFEKAYIVLEWLPHSLKGVLAQRRRKELGPLPVDDTCRWFAQIVLGIAVIHMEGIIHRDIKPSNLLISEDFEHCKVADFSSAREMHVRSTSDAGSCDGGSSGISAYSLNRGTMPYTCPEMLRGAGVHYGKKADIFSLGCVLFEMITGLPFLDFVPLQDSGFSESVLDMVRVEAAIDHAAQALHDELRRAHLELGATCRECLKEDPEQRPSAVFILSSTFALQGQIERLLSDAPRLELLIPQHNPDREAPRAQAAAVTIAATLSRPDGSIGM